MIRKKKTFILLGFLLALTLERQASAQTGAVSVTATPQAYVEVQARHKPPQSKSDPQEAAAEALGDEQSDCGRHVDISNGKAYAKVINTSTTSAAPSKLAYTLKVDTFAKGGSLIKCGECLNIFGSRQCVGIYPDYFSAHAFARASVIIDIQFSSTARLLPYNVILSAPALTGTGSSGELKAQLLDPQGNTLLSGWPAGSILIPGEPGSSYKMLIELTARAAGDGGAREQQQSEVKLDLRVERAPILESGEDPIIQGGETTAAFPEVGALLWDGQGLCSGTLIGPRTVLTAAHCVYGFGDVSRMSFVTGSTYKNPDPKDVFPVAAVYSHYDYEDRGFKNDIALVAIGGQKTFGQFYALPDEAARISGLPTLENLFQANEELNFLGFGRRNRDGQQQGEGTKRKAAMRITEISGNKFYYYNPGKSTCQGDSGGPVLKMHNGKQYVLGIASSGNCVDQGWQMQVEPYVPWIREKMQLIDGGSAPDNTQPVITPTPTCPCPCPPVPSP